MNSFFFFFENKFYFDLIEIIETMLILFFAMNE